MITSICPRILNLGDFLNCLPVLSGFYKKYNEKINFYICNRLTRYTGLIELLQKQDMFNRVEFYSSQSLPQNFLHIDDWNNLTENLGSESIIARKIKNFIEQTSNYNFDIDLDYKLQVNLDLINLTDDDKQYIEKMIDPNSWIIGDRWSGVVDLDTRKNSHILAGSGKFNDPKYVYMDYTKSLVVNCYILKNNPNPLTTCFTAVSNLADLLNKEIILFHDDNFLKFVSDALPGKDETYIHRLQHFNNRKARKSIHLNDY
jgi:hypothetical protein